MIAEILFFMSGAFFATACWFGFLWNRRYEKGKAVGWLEHHDQCHARNMARRQRNGQFKSRETLSAKPKQ